MRVEQAVVEPILLRLRAARALDLGTGVGRCLPLLASTGATTIVGVDRSLAALGSPDCDRQPESAGEAVARWGWLVSADPCHLPFRSAFFDVINASLLVVDLPDLRAWAKEVARVLSHGGHLVYSDLHPAWTAYALPRTVQPHAIDDHLDALGSAGLRVVAMREPCFNDSADPFVRDFKQRWRNPPVVAVFHATKNGV